MQWSRCYLRCICNPLMTERNVGVLITWGSVVLLFAGGKMAQLPFRVMHIFPADSASLHGGEKGTCEGRIIAKVWTGMTGPILRLRPWTS